MDTAKSALAVASPTKRKWSDHDMIEDSTSTRVMQSEGKPAAKKLGIPRKAQPLRRMVNTKPAVRGDIYEFSNANLEKPPSTQEANTKMQRSNKAAPRSEAAEPSAVDPSSPVSNSPRESKRSTCVTAAAEGQGSAFLKGGDDFSTKPVRKVGRPKKRKNATELSQKPERKGGRPRTKTATGQGPPPSPITRSDRAKHREAVRGAGRAIPKSRNGSKGSPKMPQQATADDDGEGGASDSNVTDKEELQHEKVDEDYEDYEIEAVNEKIAGNPRSCQSEFEGNMEGSEEDEEEDYKTPSQIYNDDEVVEEQMDRLGQHREWEKVLEAAASVPRTELRTQTIKELHTEIKETRSVYRRLKAFKESDHNGSKGLIEQLQENLSSIERQIEDIAEHSAATKRSETIKDIYGRAIPAMVFLLKRALSLRTSQPRGLNNFHALAEIVRIQDMVVRLCEKARGWKSRPNTTYPIVKPTTSVIFPYIRDMRNKVFAPKLRDQRVREKLKQNALNTAKAKEARLQQARRDAELSTQQGRQRDPRILQNIEEEARRRRNERNLGRRVVHIINGVGDDELARIQPAQRNGHVGPHEWTREETEELLVELNKSRKLPAGQRYLAALTNPVLQNMLPEHIRAYSLSLKPYLMEQYNSARWVKSIE